MKLQFEQDLADDDSATSAVNWIQNCGLTTRFFYDRLMVYAPNGSVAAECFSRADIIAFARRQVPARPPEAPPATPEKIRDLEEALRFTRERWRTAMAARDEWERRALAAERDVADLRASPPAASLPGQKYQQLRRYIAREFHPDNVVAGADRDMRAELFKRLWAEISRLDRG